jgi:hypothetical protein
MRQVIVRYKVKKNRVAEHQKLLRAVFRELAKTAPKGLRYSAFKESDGVSFVHVAFISGKSNPLDDSPAFDAFTDRIEERCVQPPSPVLLSEIGAYDF